MNWLQSFFSTPARQAMGWTGLGILGIVFAALGVWFLTDNGGSTGTVAAGRDDTPATATATPSATATQTRTSTPKPAATATPSPSATATATATATPRQTGGGGGAANPPLQQVPEPTATPTPTVPAVVAGGEYCSTETGTNVSLVSRVAGLFTIGGSAGPAGKTVTLLFDGVAGPSGVTVTDQGKSGFGITYGIGGADCANRPGAAISLLVDGADYATGLVVPPANPGALQVTNLDIP
ncbi:MAG: hypothetical protein FIB00_14030 [Chloroflexi bacterium]|nr:hypothetical protein [Chloroflexota bacterium]